MEPGMRTRLLAFWSALLGFFLLSALAPTVVSCTEARHGDVPPAADEADALGALDPSEIVGTIDYGQTVTVSYTYPPRYRALSFVGAAGDALDVVVHSTNGGEAKAWLLRSDFSTIAWDANPVTHDAHVTAVLPSSGSFYIALREVNLEDATFSVTLARTNAAADAGGPDGGSGDAGTDDGSSGDAGPVGVTCTSTKTISTGHGSQCNGGIRGQVCVCYAQQYTFSNVQFQFVTQGYGLELPDGGHDRFSYLVADHGVIGASLNVGVDYLTSIDSPLDTTYTLPGLDPSIYGDCTMTRNGVDVDATFNCHTPYDEGLVFCENFQQEESYILTCSGHFEFSPQALQ
jgi:hypothetical protein